jgi:hypothetical protein
LLHSGALGRVILSIASLAWVSASTLGPTLEEGEGGL